MSTNFSINSVDAFCRVLVASGLVTGDSLVEILAAFHADARDSKYGQSLTAFTTYLVANDYLTCWQCAKLRNRQYKGFFLDGFRIIDYVGTDHTCNRYLAVDGSTSECVVLCVKPPSVAPLENGKCEYWIEKLPLSPDCRTND